MTPTPGSDDKDHPPAGTATRPRRADAQRNRDRILEAAGLVFATDGTDVHVETIAEKAGVGVGTLYRHFATKQKLCEAVLLERVSALVVDARHSAEAPDPGEAFFGFLDHFLREATAKRDLVAMMGDNSALKETETVRVELADAVGVLLHRAQTVESVRPDVSATTVLAIVGAAIQAAAHSTADPHQLLAIISDGLRATPQPQSTPAEPNDYDSLQR